MQWLEPMCGVRGHTHDGDMVASGQLGGCEALGVCAVSIKDEQGRTIGGWVYVFYEVTWNHFTNISLCNQPDM